MLASVICVQSRLTNWRKMKTMNLCLNESQLIESQYSFNSLRDLTYHIPNIHRESKVEINVSNCLQKQWKIVIFASYLLYYFILVLFLSLNIAAQTNTFIHFKFQCTNAELNKKKFIRIHNNITPVTFQFNSGQRVIATSI